MFHCQLIVCLCISMLPAGFQALHQDALPKLPSQVESSSELDPSMHLVDSQLPGKQMRLMEVEPRVVGPWRLEWNDSLESTEYPHSCSVQMKEHNDRLSGQFIGPVAGRHRDATIIGRFEDTLTRKLINFQQHEQGYICSYQGLRTKNKVEGVWHDTSGRSGKFRMTQEPIRTTSTARIN